MLLTIVVFLLILALLILVHEVGHFLVAKRNGVPSEEFGFGFPPRIVGTYKDGKGKRKWIWGSKKIEDEIRKREETVFSINWIPLGGFVKIKGENGEEPGDPKSFSNQSIWTRFKILIAGVSMNFLLAIVLFTFAFWIGLPEVIDDAAQVDQSKVQIAMVVPGSPAQEAGMKAGDEIVSVAVDGQESRINTVSQLQEAVAVAGGNEVQVGVIRAGETEAETLSLMLRTEVPEGEGPMGVQLVRTSFVSHNFFESFWLAIKTSISLVFAILAFLWDLLARLFTAQPVPVEIAGPVGIAVLTGQVTKLGIAFILQFAALLSINLAIINLLPIPALDGGRILFLGIEKVKGSPVSRNVEGIIHTAGFMLLLLLMLLITIRDVKNFEIVEKVKDIF